MRWYFAFFPIFLSSKVICQKIDVTKSSNVLFELRFGGQNVTKYSESVYGWIQNIGHFSSSLLRSLLQFGANVLGFAPRVRSRMAKSVRARVKSPQLK